MFHDVKGVSLSPSKGKGKETSHWQAGWWEFLPLTEQPQRPIKWSSASTIFSAHPTKPLINARHFSSSKQFTLLSPQPILSSPTSFAPPTLITIAPSDEWLFAYFPGHNHDGVGCLWKRGLQADTWIVREWWTFARGAGAVTAEWAGLTREWSADASGAFSRLPPRGPRTPVSNPTLLVVTQNHKLQICYFRAYIPSMKIMSCSLTQPSAFVENQSNQNVDSSSGLDGVRLCVHASIGIGYNESSILIATRSHNYPTASNIKSPSFNSMDPGLPLDEPRQDNDNLESFMEWDTCGEESTIDLCEALLKFDGYTMSLFARTLAPIHYPRPNLTKLVFICTPSRSIVKPSQSPSLPHRGGILEQGQFHLAASSLDFGDYTSPPKSELALYSLRSIPGPKPGQRSWTTHHEATRIFTSGVMTFFSPCLGPASVGIYAMVLHTTGTISRRKTRSKEVSIGTVCVLKIPDLSDDGEWQNSHIMASVNQVGRDLPLIATTSPNFTLLCTMSSSLHQPQTSIHTLPKRSGNGGPLFSTGIPALSPVIALALLSRKTTSDLTRTLSLPIVSVAEVGNTLYNAFSLLESKANGQSEQRTLEALGLALECYRMRSNVADLDVDKAKLTVQWRTALDMCSMAACNSAFENCKDGDSYDLEAVWQLVGLSGWIIGILENVMKESILCWDLSKPETSGDVPDSTAPTSESQLPSPVLLHLVQPFAFANLHSALRHVQNFRTQLGSLNVRGENARIARDVLVDLVDCSGVDLAALESVLADAAQDISSISDEDARRGLAACRLTLPLYPPLRKVVQRIMVASAVDKPRLFIKPPDLVDGVSRMSLGEGQKKEKEKDIISKGGLVKQGPGLLCLRCNSRSEVGASHASLRWRVWEYMWVSRCLCGGLWTSGSV